MFIKFCLKKITKLVIYIRNQCNFSEVFYFSLCAKTFLTNVYVTVITKFNVDIHMYELMYFCMNIIRMYVCVGIACK